MSRGGYKHAMTEIKMAVIERPVREGGASKQGRAVIQRSKCFKYKGVGGGGGFDVAGQHEVKGVNDHGVREDGSISIVPSSVEVISPGESISRSHVSARGDFPDKIEILEKERPASLPSREFARVLEIGQILVISEDRDRVRSPL